MNDWFALALLLAVLGCWAGTLWAARSRIGEMQGRLDKARAEAARATGLLGQAMVRENGLNAANAALRRALDAELARNDAAWLRRWLTWQQEMEMERRRAETEEGEA